MKQKITDETLKDMRGAVTLLHGVFDPSFFDVLKARNPKYVYVMEGRPSLEAGKSSCKELLKMGMKPVIIADNMAGFLFYKKMVKEVWLSYVDRDHHGALCHIGASILGLLAKEHDVPVYIYRSSAKKNFDPVADGSELINFNGKRVAPKGTKAYVPLFEWVPGRNFIQNEDEGNENDLKKVGNTKKISDVNAKVRKV